MKISRARILQISNDVTERCVDATKAELIEVVRFWQRRNDDWSELLAARMSEVSNIMVNHLQKPGSGIF